MQRPRRPSRATYELLAVTAVAMLARVYALGAEPLWLDEATSIHFARYSLGVIPFIDPLPLLYYYLLHFWLVLGDGEVVVRSLSVLFSVATVPLVYGLGRTLAGRHVGLLAALLVALAPFQVRYAQEARTYALVGFTATTAMWGLAWIVLHLERAAVATVPIRRADAASRSPHSTAAPPAEIDREALLAWLAFVVGTAGMLWSHQVCLLFVAAANVSMLWLVAAGVARRPGLLRRWLIAQAAILALWLPAVPFFIAVSRRTLQSYWMPPIDARYVLETIRALYLAPYVEWLRPLPDLLLATVAAAGLWAWRRDVRRLAVCLPLLVLPLVLEIIVSIVRPLLLPHSLIWTGIVFLVLVANGAMSLRRRAAQAALAVALLTVSTAGVAGYYRHEHKEAWDEAAAYVAGHISRKDLIVFVAGYVDVPFEYYFRRYGSGAERYETRMRGVTEESTRMMLERAREHARVWLVVSHAQYADPRELTVTALREHGRQREERSFYGVDVLLFEM